MPSKRGIKRKNGKFVTRADADGEAALLPPNRNTWPGWVEMESEPAFFNVMLREMGVRGVKVQEIFSLDEGDLAFLPRPVHALIFLFKYKVGDDEGTGTNCPDHVWFANQIPDFACGTVALLNIINNIPGLEMGKELKDFKDFTKDMDPLTRGDALDNFDYVRKIHNSFARESDMLNADVLMQAKIGKIKRKQASAIALRAKKLKNAPLAPKPINVPATPGRTSHRKLNGTIIDAASSPTDLSSPLSEPPDSDSDFSTRKRAKATLSTSDTPSKPIRKSARKPKPRQITHDETAETSEDEGDFHFIAYIPIAGHVWKLDGMDWFPQDIGTLGGEAGEDWMNIAAPILRTRMALHEAGGIEFNLMAVVHDPVESSRTELAQNVKSILAIDHRLDSSQQDWRALDGAEMKKDVVVNASEELGISPKDVENATVSTEVKDELEKDADHLSLVALRARIIGQQAPLRGAVRDAQLGWKSDEDEAWHRRYDYGTFVKSWLGKLAEHELLAELLAE